jgi:hypothetical protein
LTLIQFEFLDWLIKESQIGAFYFPPTSAGIAPTKRMISRYLAGEIVTSEMIDEAHWAARAAIPLAKKAEKKSAMMRDWAKAAAISADAAAYAMEFAADFNRSRDTASCIMTTAFAASAAEWWPKRSFPVRDATDRWSWLPWKPSRTSLPPTVLDAWRQIGAALIRLMQAAPATLDVTSNRAATKELTSRCPHCGSEEGACHHLLLTIEKEVNCALGGSLIAELEMLNEAFKELFDEVDRRQAICGQGLVGEATRDFFRSYGHIDPTERPYAELKRDYAQEYLLDALDRAKSDAMHYRSRND